MKTQLPFDAIQQEDRAQLAASFELKEFLRTHNALNPSQKKAAEHFFLHEEERIVHWD
jgi:hypothetical protein